MRCPRVGHSLLDVCLAILLCGLAGYSALAQTRGSSSPTLISRQMGSIRNAGYAAAASYGRSSVKAPLATLSGGALPSEARGEAMAAGLLPSERRGNYLATGKRPFGNTSGTIRYGASRGYGASAGRRQSPVGQWASQAGRTGPSTVSMSSSLARPIGTSSPGSIRYGGRYSGGGGYARGGGGGYSMRPAQPSGSYFARPIGGTIRYSR